MQYWEQYFNEILDNLKFSEDLIKDKTIIGVGALILNGLSYCPLEGCISVLCSSPAQHNWHSGLFLYQYLPNYNKEIGYEDLPYLPSPERAICDYLLYPDWLAQNPVYEAIQFYEDDPDLGDLEQIVEMALKLGIEERKIRSLIQDAQDLRY